MGKNYHMIHAYQIFCSSHFCLNFISTSVFFLFFTTLPSPSLQGVLLKTCPENLISFSLRMLLKWVRQVSLNHRTSERQVICLISFQAHEQFETQNLLKHFLLRYKFYIFRFRYSLRPQSFTWRGQSPFGNTLSVHINNSEAYGNAVVVLRDLSKGKIVSSKQCWNIYLVKGGVEWEGREFLWIQTSRPQGLVGCK